MFLQEIIINLRFKLWHLVKFFNHHRFPEYFEELWLCFLLCFFTQVCYFYPAHLVWPNWWQDESKLPRIKTLCTLMVFHNKYLKSLSQSVPEHKAVIMWDWSFWSKDCCIQDTKVLDFVYLLYVFKWNF